jgi:hypothetical protein
MADMIKKTSICWFINPDREQAGNGNNKRDIGVTCNFTD